MLTKHRVESILARLNDAIAGGNEGEKFDAMAIAYRLLGSEIPQIGECYDETIDYSGAVNRNTAIIAELVSAYLETYSNLSFNADDYITRDKELNTLLADAIELYNSNQRTLAVEKLWDAFERMKTYFVLLKKPKSADKVIEIMSNSNSDYISMYSEEFEKLTKIGNDFRIRHHETNKIDITDSNDYDYFFMRCLALVFSAISRLQKVERDEV